MSDGDAKAWAETVAYMAIRRVQHQYADIMTRRAWSELSDIFAQDCAITIDIKRDLWKVTGPDQIGDLIARQVQRFDFFEFIALSTVMRIDVEAGQATTRLYMQEVRHHGTEFCRSDAFGVYHDVLKHNDDGAWRYKRRHYRSLARTPETNRPEANRRCEHREPTPKRDMEVLGSSNSL